MRVALMAAGQPRFTPAFPIFLNQLKGITQADLYFYFWDSDWAHTAEEAAHKIQPYLIEPFQIKKIVIEPEPSYLLPPHVLEHNTEEKESVRWWYRRRRAMWTSIHRVFNLIPDEYDMIIKFRGEGRLDRDIDLNTIDLSKGAVSPENARHGTVGREACDQFCLGKYEDMKFFSNMINHFDRYISEVYPQWEYDVHKWSSEHLLGWHYFKNIKYQVPGNFKFALKFEGRSNFDDKDLHIPITQQI